MNKAKRYLCGFAVLAGLFVIGSLMRSPESQAKGAYSSPVTVLNTSSNPVPITGAVSNAVPNQPFFAKADGVSGPGVLIGPGSGTLAITSITLTNGGPVQNSISIFSQNIGSGLLGACSGPLGARGEPDLTVLVPPSQTIHLTFPIPLVFKPNGAEACVGVVQNNLGGTITLIYFNGFVQ